MDHQPAQSTGTVRALRAASTSRSHLGSRTQRHRAAVLTVLGQRSSQAAAGSGVVKLIGYVRVSTDRQAEHGLGLDVQRAAINAWAKAEGHKITDWQEDAGESGANGLDSRPGLKAAFIALENGEANGLVVYRLDRLSRKLGAQEVWIDQLQSHGCEVISVTEPGYGDDEMRVLVRQVTGAFAEYERHVIRRRMQSGRKLKAERGGYAGYGSPAFGQRAKDGELVTDEDEQAVIAKMLELSAAGLSTRLIATELNADGLLSKRGTQWHSATVARVLRRHSSE